MQNATFQACQACYMRKKRCVTSPDHSQCTYCLREGQRCLPRKRPTKQSTQSQPQATKNKDNSSASSSPETISTRQTYDTPRSYIESEIPPWSAMYSMVSEALRLIPPEGSFPKQAPPRKRPASEHDEDQVENTENSDKGDREQDPQHGTQHSGRHKRSCSVYEAISARQAPHVMAAGLDSARWTTAGETPRSPNTLKSELSKTVKVVNVDVNTKATGESTMIPKSPSTGAFFGELDALLRF
ncbi:hypothetical protein POX_d06001 [Penicillium oxalicum]|uniref:hypothetical protein n=1 Tax=Penicillium oxalicum TaxID=69781 RepID=UPI0020B77387|nr:hypothetical protein POX_d06001 [Penicillium oxalicum]KAI2790485.1 hypothetical protein POX_d06001 [Penicillium oxalicum]